MVTDLETGKPRGFAFVEFENAQDALSAIRNMNEHELNGRKIRVNFSNSSHLETLAGQLGMDMTQKTKGASSGSNNASGGTASASTSAGGGSASGGMGTQAVANALKSMSRGEMYDVVAKLKDIADSDPDEARKIISGHPQLSEAILYLMSQLDMMKTPAPATGGMVPPPPMMDAIPVAPTLAVPTVGAGGRVDPRTAAVTSSIPPPPVPIDPRDPRNRVDPRRQQAQPAAPTSSVPPPPPQQMYMPGMPQPPPGVPPPPPMGVAGLDPALVQQVMGLTPAQIAQLPPDKQNSILALRQQIQSAMGATA